MLSTLVTNRWFALFDLLLIIISGVIWILIPEYGIWFTLIALLPRGLMLLACHRSFPKTPLTWLLVIFLLTSWVGYWAAYDKESAWVKVWLIVTSVLLYFALSTQPKQNIAVLSALSFAMAVGISIYFYLTHTFITDQGKIVQWWMNNRPQVSWRAIHQGYISGLLTITSAFGFNWLWLIVTKEASSYFTKVLKALLVLGVGAITGAFILSMSRGIWLAIGCGLGAWVLWKIVSLDRFVSNPGLQLMYPSFLLIYLSVFVALIYLGPAGAGGTSTQNKYGENTRAEVFERGIYFLADYPITGGGLNSFPGLYSQYMIVIPFYYFINSYNTFLDVAIEQGIIGGLVFVILYLGNVWRVSQAISKTRLQKEVFLNWFGLFALIVAIIHGLFYDYLYNGNGTMLLFFPIGMSVMEVKDSINSEDKLARSTSSLQASNKITVRLWASFLIVGVFAVFFMNHNKVTALWNANLGAVQMSQVELADFPTNGWAGPNIALKLDSAETSLRTALQSDPTNQTANYRLGLISMLRRDFESASKYLEAAYLRAPNHRGIIKSLGYCYIWLGNLEKAQKFLVQIPETVEELDAYIWWWGVQERNDLSENAILVLDSLRTVVPSP